MEEPGAQIPSSRLELQGYAGMNVAASQHQVHMRTKFDCVTFGLANEGTQQKSKKMEMAH